ncbi:MAG: glycoside hydrolase family 3 C-terminal domain-containing protein, partial [Candidatus Coproplasma sp.]
MTRHKKQTKKLMSLLAVAMTMVIGVGTTGVGAVFASADSPYAGKYYTDYNTFDEAKKAAEQLTREIAQEGDVLLKNKDNALPLSGREWVSVFGVTSDNLVGASDSSGAFSGSSEGGSTVAAALENAGFKVNPMLKNFYANNDSELGHEETNFSGQVKESFNLYKDVAFIVLSREGGEGSDASRVTSETVSGAEDNHKALCKVTTQAGGEEGPIAPQADTDEYYKHSLMLTDSEEALINTVKTQFKKVVVILNTSNAMEIQSLKDDDDIDGIINIGRPGSGGLDGLADILIGKVSPSGGLVDEWMTDFTADPTWYNFGNNNQTAGYGDSAGSSAYMNSQGVKTGSADTLGGTAYESGEGYYGVDYEEGIYLGYKYYETVYTEIAEGNLNYNTATKELTENATCAGVSDESKAAAAAWWNDNVTYQYGYGLSYTTFSFNAGGLYTNKALTSALGSTVSADKFNSSVGNRAEVEKLYVPVTVTNTGKVAGKKTVQVYVTAPYIAGGVEKAAVSLVGFAKTDVIEPGKSQTIVVEVNVQDMASWDSTASNGGGSNGHYILDGGEYTVRVMENSHYDYE